jgi:hypothetical protein
MPGYYRATWESIKNGSIVVTVNATHPAARRYFGPGPDFPNQDLIAAKLLIAEVVAEEAVRDILSRKYGPTPTDVVTYYVERLRLLNELLPKCHATQVTDSELTSHKATQSSIQESAARISKKTVLGKMGAFTQSQLGT